jgi:hypothetical protein
MKPGRSTSKPGPRVLARSCSKPGPNEIDITLEECVLVQALNAFDLTMFLSEIHDHGWPHARRTLSFIANQPEYKFLKKSEDQDHA